MYRFMEKLPVWQQVLLIIIIFILALLSFGQAISFAWLSSFPEQAIQLERLEIKFWAYILFGVFLAVSDVWMVVNLIQQINKKK